MVSACKAHITDNDTLRVWDVEPKELLKRFQACHNLSKHYQVCVEHAKDRASNVNRPFEVSEMYVFGKFASFCRRLVQIQEMVETIQQFGILKLSHIEGIESLANRFGHIVSSTCIKKKSYNPLDHRKMEFVSDYEDFQRQVAELEDSLSTFMTTVFSQISSSLQALKLLRR